MHKGEIQRTGGGGGGGGGGGDSTIAYKGEIQDSTMFYYA